eukprot:1387848-Rhodomonas_salina.1
MQDLVHVRSYSVRTMDAFIHDVDKPPASHFTQYSMTMWHRQRVGGAREAYARAVAGGDGAARERAATVLAALEGRLSQGEPESKSGLDGETA